MLKNSNMTKQSLSKTVSSKMNVKSSSSPGRFVEKGVVNGFVKSSQRTIPAKIVPGVYDVRNLESVSPSNIQGIGEFQPASNIRGVSDTNFSKQHPKRAYNYSEAPSLKYLSRDIPDVADVEPTAPSKLTGNTYYKGTCLDHVYLTRASCDFFCFCGKFLITAQKFNFRAFYLKLPQYDLIPFFNFSLFLL